MSKDIFYCPECKNRLYFRYHVQGFVCKNWRCRNYWKHGHGPVLKSINEMEFENMYDVDPYDLKFGKEGKI